MAIILRNNSIRRIWVPARGRDDSGGDGRRLCKASRRLAEMIRAPMSLSLKCRGRLREPPGAGDAEHDQARARDHAPCDRFAEQQRGQRQPEERLQQLQLADSCDAAEREA